MTTTHPEPVNSENPPKPTTRGPGDISLVFGLLLAPLGFVFGGYAALLALPGVFVARLRPAAFAFFAGTVVCAGLSMAGVNPYAAWARESALDRLEAALGARPEYSGFEAGVGSGEMRFENLSVKLPEIGGSAQIVQLRLATGPGFVWNWGTPKLEGRGLRVVFDGASERLDKFLSRLEQTQGGALEISLESIELVVRGPSVEATLLLNSARGQVDAEGRLSVLVSARQLELKLWERTHKLQLAGNAAFSRAGGRTGLTVDMKVVDQDVLMGYLHGELMPQPGPGGLVFTLDQLDLGPLWARYRVIDTYKGRARGAVHVSGTLQNLLLGLDLEVTGYEYFHRAVMALDEGRAFRVPAAAVKGGLRLRAGADVIFESLQLEVPDGTLCTDPAMNAQGSATLTLQGQYPALTGDLKAQVKTGRLRRGVSWSPVNASSIVDCQPNVIQVAEQFSSLRLNFEVDVQRLDVECEPVAGWLTGKLTGTLDKQPGTRQAALRVDGQLELKEGKVAFCALQGQVSGAIVFSPREPSYEARLNGALEGTAGDTKVTAEIAGTLSLPFISFTGIEMAPDRLGNKIATWSQQPLSKLEQAQRAEALTRVCGPAAAMNNNPFLAHKAGRVSFTFKP